MYVNVEIYNVEQGLELDKVEFPTVDQRRNNVVNMIICKKLKNAKNIFELHKKMSHLINNAYFRLWLIRKKGKHGTYNLKVNVGNYSVWYMKKMWKWQCEFAGSLLNRMSSLPTCQRGLRANVLAASVVYVLTCFCANLPKACQLLIFTYQRSNKRATVPYGVPMFQLGMPTCQMVFQCFNLACQRLKRCANFSNIPLTKCYGKFLYFIIVKNSTSLLIL